MSKKKKQLFYIFHHVPKCGGTSFNGFLETIFKVHDDYSYKGRFLDPIKRPDQFELHRTNTLDLSKMGPEDCIAGHFGHPGVFIWERYPELETLPHRKFTIIRDPYDAAKSGVRFGIKRGKLPQDMTPQAMTNLLLRRSQMFGRIFGITSIDQVEDVMSKFWLVAPLEEIDVAAQLIAKAAGKTCQPVEHVNRTVSNEDDFTPSAEAQFRGAAKLDCAIYDYALRRFAKKGHGVAK